MSKEYIRDYKTGRILEMIETDERGRRTAKDYTTRKILGRYDPQEDKTRDFYSRILTRGDSTSSLYKK